MGTGTTDGQTEADLEHLRKIDEMRRRTRLSYSEARALLDEADGNVVEALILHERAQRLSRSGWETQGQVLLDRVKALLQKGNATRVRVTRGERTLLEIPVTAGVIGALVAPELAVLSGAACLFGGCKVELGKAQEPDHVSPSH